jgi:hypothetical protein
VPKHKFESSCSCSDVDFVIRYECDEAAEEFFCPFCGIRIDDVPLDEDEEDDDYDY